MENWNFYRDVARASGKIFSKVKKESFKAFCSTFSSDSSISKVWKTIKDFKRRFQCPNASQTENNSPLDNASLKDTFRGLGINQQYGDLSFLNDNSEEIVTCESDLNSSLNKRISVSEVISAINLVKDRKSPGLDGIPYEIPKNFTSPIIEWLTEFYNLVLEHKSIPKIWSNYKVVLIPKGNTEKFRPIALSCVFLKLLERVVCDRLNWRLESQGIIPRNFLVFVTVGHVRTASQY